MKTKVAIIDDQTLIREGIRSLLALSQDVEIVAEGDNGTKAIPIAKEFDPDVILMDIRMPELNGIEAIKSLREQDINVPVLILTTFDDHDAVIRGIQAGANGYLLKDVSLETLLDAITTLARGETLIQPAITEKVLQSLQSKQPSFEANIISEPLSEKEKEILRLIAGGYSNKEISEAMFKSEGTVKNQVSSVLQKLGVRDRTRAVLKAIELGLI